MPGLEKALPYIGAAQDSLFPLVQHFQNVKNRKFAREMYQRQRQDSLADWAMQNEYNSPRAQMQRFQEAGLNPHLIYGQMNEGAVVRSSNAPNAQGEAPRFTSEGLRTGLMMQYDMRQKSAQTDLIAKQMQLADEEVLLKKAQTVATLIGATKTGVDTERAKVGLAVDIAIKDYQIQAADLHNKKTMADIEFTLDQNERARIMNAKSVEKMEQEIYSIILDRAKTRVEMDEARHRIMIMKKDGVLKDFDIKMRKDGINPGDPGYWKVLQYIIGKAGENNIPLTQPWKGESSGSNKRGTWRELPAN